MKKATKSTVRGRAKARGVHTRLLSDTVQSMRTHGQVVPVLLRRTGTHRYKIVDGLHRIEALKVLGQLKVIAQVDGEIIEVGVHQCSL